MFNKQLNLHSYIYKIHVVNVLNKYKNNTCNKN